MTELGVDDKGFPIMLAAPGIDLPAKSGNPAHVPKGQPGAGRFGTRKKESERPGQPGIAQVTAEEIARRMDAIREAAREMEEFSAQDITEWLRGKTNRQLSDGEIRAFVADVRAQQLSDLVDILDQNERGSRRSRRHVKVTAPRGYTRKTLNSLSDEELRVLANRLRARGWNSKQVKGLVKRLPENRQSTIEGLSEVDLVLDEPPTEQGIDLAALAGNVASAAVRNMPAPQVHVTVQPQKPMRKIPHRGEDGLITHVDEEPIDAR